MFVQILGSAAGGGFPQWNCNCPNCDGLRNGRIRATARTLLDEELGFRPDYIEHQLAHAVRDPNGRAYNRTAHLPERRKMMQEWADTIDRAKRGEQPAPLRRVA